MLLPVLLHLIYYLPLLRDFFLGSSPLSSLLVSQPFAGMRPEGSKAQSSSPTTIPYTCSHPTGMGVRMGEVGGSTFWRKKRATETIFLLTTAFLSIP